MLELTGGAAVPQGNGARDERYLSGEMPEHLQAYVPPPRTKRGRPRKSVKS
jgi:hypothetical protein